MSKQRDDFSKPMNEDEKEAMEQGLNATFQTLDQSLIEYNNNNNNNNNNTQIKLNLNNTFNNISNLHQNNISNISNRNKKRRISEISPDNDNNLINNGVVINEIIANKKLISKINENLLKLPTLTIAEKLLDAEFREFIKEYKKFKFELFELIKIEYKIKLHISSNFIPRNERFKINLNKKQLFKRTINNYNYIESTLNEAVKISKNNYMNKLKEKRNKIKHTENIINIITKNIENKINAKIQKLKNNELKLKSQTIKSAIYNNYNSEINKLNLEKLKIDEHYENEFRKYKNKLILSFEKLINKINLKINTNNIIKYNFMNDLKEAKDEKELNKMKQFNDKYEPQNNKINTSENKYQFINGQKMFKSQFNQNDIIFHQFNYVNIPNDQRAIITDNFGNIHDKYQYKLHLNSNKRKENYNKHKNHQKGFYKRLNKYNNYKYKTNKRKDF